MKVVSIIGFLDAGKSSLIRVLLAEVERRGLTAGVIVNDSGTITLEDLAPRYPVQVIGGGWIGCSEAGSFVRAIKDMARMGLRYLFAEPSGIVIPLELRNNILVAGRDVDAVQGAVVLVIDGTDPEFPFVDDLAHVTRQQVEQSDLVVINKLDAADSAAVVALMGRVREIAADRDVMRVSLQSGDGVGALLDAVLSRWTQKEAQEPRK